MDTEDGQQGKQPPRTPLPGRQSPKPPLPKGASSARKATLTSAKKGTPTSARKVTPGGLSRRVLPVTPVSRKKTVSTGKSATSSRKKADTGLAAEEEERVSADDVLEEFLLLIDSFPKMPLSEKKKILHMLTSTSGVGGKWAILARYLGVSDEEIDKIKEMYHFDNERCMQMLAKIRGQDLTYSKLSYALANTLQYDLVRELKKLIPDRSYDEASCRSMHVLPLPLKEAGLVPLVEEMKRKLSSGWGVHGGGEVEITVQCVPEVLSFRIAPGHMKVVEYLLKALAQEGAKEVIITVNYFSIRM